MNDQTNPELELPIEKIDSLIKRVDEDRWLASRYAPKPARARLMVLYGFQLECVRALHMSEPMLGHIRLQWWREAIEEIGIGQTPRRHDLTLQMAELLSFAPALSEHLFDYLDCFDAQIAAVANGAPSNDLVTAGGYLAQMAGNLITDVVDQDTDHLAVCGQAYEAARMKTDDAVILVKRAASVFSKIEPELIGAIAHAGLAQSYLTRPSLPAIQRRWKIFTTVMRGQF